MNSIKLNKVDADYAWAACSKCRNTVKFDMTVLESVCPACGTKWLIANSGDDEAVEADDQIHPEL